MSKPTYDFFCDNGGEVIIPVAEFERSAEHVTLLTHEGRAYTIDGRREALDITPDDLHPWERDLVTNGAPFARPSNRVRS